MTRRGRWLVAAAAVSLGCSPDPPASAGRPMPAGDLLARVNDLARHHRVVEALELLESQQAVLDGLEPDSPQALALREKQALLELNVSRPRQAASRLEDLVRRKPADARLRGFLAQAYHELGESAKAVEAFHALPPAELGKRLVSHGEALLEAGRTSEGLAALAASQVRDPWDGGGCLALGRALVRLGRQAAGAAFLDRYRRDEPFRSADQEALAFEAAGDEGRAWHRRARAEAARGRLFDAVELEQRALHVSRGLGDAYLEMARISIRLGRPSDAVKALQQLPDDPVVARAVAEARAEDERADGPRARARDSMRGRPLSACVPELIGLAGDLAAAGDGAEARAVALFALRLGGARGEAGAAVRRRFDAADEVFVRLWVDRAALPAPSFEARLGAELAPLGIEASLVLRVLASVVP